MSRRSSESPAPFEVLSRRSRLSRGPDAPGGPEPPASQPGGVRSWLDTALLRARQPIVIRAPRGYVLLLGVAVAALVLLAYWVGYSRNPHRAASPAPGPGTAPSALRPAGHPLRGPGQKYLALVAFGPNPGDPDEHRGEALRCARFLHSQGVEVSVEPVDNGGLELVCLRGFDPAEIGSDAYYDEFDRLRHLGRLWHSQHRGPSDFSMMRLREFPPGPASP